MMTQVTGTTLISAIRGIVEKQLEPARIERVEVARDVDHDGDPVLRIRIVFDVKGDRLNSKAVLGLARHLREPLEQLNVDDFPTFSFATVKEDRAAAA